MNRRHLSGILLGVMLPLLLASGNCVAQYPLTAGIAALATGALHTCALSTSGGVKCWGDNSAGQLGDNTSTPHLTPMDVFGLTVGVTAIATGSFQTCALTRVGGVKCWGNNGNGQLGDNSFTQRNIPVDVVGLASGVSAISSGSLHTCALTASGGVKCWGSNSKGQLGDNSNNQTSTPVDVSGLTAGVTAIAAGGLHTCALTASGGVKCWGANDFGQLGDDSIAQRLIPVDVSGLTSGVRMIAMGGVHGCALTLAGGVMCWGNNGNGRLGDNTTTDRHIPVAALLGFLQSATAISAGGSHTCLITSNGGVKCWGSNNVGQLGDDSVIPRLVPTTVPGLAAVGALAAGSTHTCALTSGGGVKCWGNNFEGELGDNSIIVRFAPVDVLLVPLLRALSGVKAVSGGDDHTCALTRGGGAKCWGFNNHGQLGDKSTTTRITPVDVGGLAAGVSAISAGFRHTCALTGGGGIKCWGLNSQGQLGDNSTTTRQTPVDVVGLSTGVMAVAASGNFTCALTSGGGVKCWGEGGNGRLGSGTTAEYHTPVDVIGLTSGVSAIAAGGEHACALMISGGVKCWGYNLRGQLGDNTIVDRMAPVDVSGLNAGISAISAKDDHTCALTTLGGVKCWGGNNYGQLGNDSISNNLLTPVDVLAGPLQRPLRGVGAIAVGYAYTCALMIGGGVKCWGSNGLGNVGDNTVTTRLTPVDVVAGPLQRPLADVVSISAGFRHTCALTGTGQLKCWGYNFFGTLGDDSTTERHAPVDVLSYYPMILYAVQSRKTHGAAGTFDLQVDSTEFINGAVTVESRTGGAGHVIAFQFFTPISTGGSASAADSNNISIATSVAAGAVASEVLVTLTGVADNSRATITLAGVSPTFTATAAMGFLVGDVNNTRSVNSSDISGVKARSGQATTATNFLYDVNATGAINSSDISAVKARSGAVLVQ